MSAVNQQGARRDWTSPYAFEVQRNLLGGRISCTTVSERIALSGMQGNILMLTNPDIVTVYVAIGDSTVEATTAHMPILPETKEIFSLPDGFAPTHVAGITAGGSAGLVVHIGFGV